MFLMKCDVISLKILETLKLQFLPSWLIKLVNKLTRV